MYDSPVRCIRCRTSCLRCLFAVIIRSSSPGAASPSDGARRMTGTAIREHDPLCLRRAALLGRAEGGSAVDRRHLQRSSRPGRPQPTTDERPPYADQAAHRGLDSGLTAARSCSLAALAGPAHSRVLQCGLELSDLGSSRGDPPNPLRPARPGRLTRTPTIRLGQRLPGRRRQWPWQGQPRDDLAKRNPTASLIGLSLQQVMH